ncbi:hypothetical protein Zmor_024620 [Zophobas morio]|uniref:Uncharacterized protein n=1 Tax=Zophobas morio TaxID=2755281 RepID=A0AA38I0L2_9CUCU|nr:hypothetical protein Zmor_024620 [Zophobas morio]
MYTNLGSLTAKFDDLTALVTQQKPTILLITETWLNSNITDSIVSLPNYILYRSDRKSGRGGGVCIYLSTQIVSTFSISPLDIVIDNFQSSIVFRTKLHL